MSLLTLRQQSNIVKILLKNVNQISSLKTNCSLIELKPLLKVISQYDRGFTSRSKLNVTDQTDTQSQLFDFHEEWPVDIKNEILRDMILIENFVNETEEEQLLAEVLKAMKRMRYQYDHWDDAIHGFKEMEKQNWLPENEQVFQRLRNKAFAGNVLPHVHILDLAADGIIKPHVDSSRYCGSTIAGISLHTDCIMRLKRVDEVKYKQNRFGEDKLNTNQFTQHDVQPKTNGTIEYNYFVDVLLKQRSLYIMKDSARYKFSHEVLPSKSTFKGNEIIKNRRVSIICRNQP